MNEAHFSAHQQTVVFDMDGVLATGTTEDVYSDAAGWSYEKCDPLHEGIALARWCKEHGYRVVIMTARWEQDRAKTQNWLSWHKVPYDELIMGKPSAVLYIDDRALRFKGDGTALSDIRQLLRHATTPLAPKTYPIGPSPASAHAGGISVTVTKGGHQR